MMNNTPSFGGIGSQPLITDPNQVGQGVIRDEHIANLTADKITAGVLSGVRINGGALFSDTLGGFFPIVVTPRGGITVNGSNANSTVFSFHNTASALTDELMLLADSGAFFFSPNSATSVNTPVVINDRNVGNSNYLGIIFDPAFVGSVTLPRIRTSTAVGTATTNFFNGNFFTNSANGGFEADAADGTTSAWLEVGNGFDPTLSVFGSNAAINLFIQPKGTGTIGIVKATVGAGGGAGATLITVGGSGPANAAQAAWLRIMAGASGTTTYWLPLWT